MNFFKHHIGDYDADTSHLSWLEDMAYTRLMRLYYRREQPIPADVAQACRLVRATSKQERQAVAAVLAEFFVLGDDGWRNKRCDEEIAHAEVKAEANRTNGAKGGRPKKQANPKETQSVPESEEMNNPTGFVLDSEKNLSQTPDTRHQKPEGKTKTRRASASGVDVDDLVLAGVDRQHAVDWLEVRRVKKLPLTPTAWADVRLEAEKAGLTAAQAIAHAAAHGQAGFKAAWLVSNGAGRGGGFPSKQGAMRAENHSALDSWIGERQGEVIDV